MALAKSIKFSITLNTSLSIYFHIVVKHWNLPGVKGGGWGQSPVEAALFFRRGDQFIPKSSFENILDEEAVITLLNIYLVLPNRCKDR
jgi:hypothetical protein